MDGCHVNEESAAPWLVRATELPGAAWSDGDRGRENTWHHAAVAEQRGQRQGWRITGNGDPACHGVRRHGGDVAPNPVGLRSRPRAEE